MKKRLLSFTLIVILMYSSFVNSFAAYLDTTSPYTGQFLLAINTSTDVSISIPTGTISGDISSIESKSFSISSTEPTIDEMPIIGEAELDGVKIYQLDPRQELDKRPELLEDVCLF